MSQVIEQRVGRLLGNFGMVPFYLLAVAAFMPLGEAASRFLLIALVGYGAVILSFLGAVHWGLTLLTPKMTKAQAWNSLAWGVTPALLGWLALLLAAGGLRPWLIIVVLLGDFAICRLMDSALLRNYPDVPAWYLGLRTQLTLGVMLALLIALAAYL
jgi:hypothetical protein